MTDEDSETDGLNLDIIDEAWRSVRTRKLYESNNEDVNVKSLASLFSLLVKLNELPVDSDPTDILENSNLSSLNKQHILHLWHSRIEEGIKWGIDVIVGNSNIKKSLHPKIWLFIDGQEIEMNLEAFAKLRFQVSRVLSRIL